MTATSSITLRAATPDDAAALARLRWEFRSVHAPPVDSESAFRRRCREWMRRRLRDGRRWRAWVAETDAAIVGNLWVHLLEKMPNPGDEPERHAYVTNLYVAPTARGGIGSRLLQAGLDWIATQHVDQVMLWPSTRSRSLYARFGFAPAGHVMTLKLQR